MSNSESSGRRKLSQEEVTKTLESHSSWASTSPHVGQAADLSEADLAEFSLKNVDLSGANLTRSIFTRGNLREAKFSDANLNEADLSHADLFNAQFPRANLLQTILSSANLQMANFKEATLTDANLQGADLSQAFLQGATLLRTVLKDTNLQDANLMDSKGLLAKQLTGADVSGAKLPEEIKKFDALAQAQELSKSAKKLFVAILLGCVYSWLTIYSTKDAALLANSASSPLPIIQTPIPIAGFFGVAPFILLALFTYFHLYLQRLWRELASLPAVFPDGMPLDEKAYPWILNSLLRAHVSRLTADRPPLSRLEVGISVLLAWWVVPFTVGLFWLRSLQRHDPVLTGFLIVFMLCGVVFAVWFQHLTKITLRGHQQPPIRFTGDWINKKPYKECIRRSSTISVVGTFVVLLGCVISYGAIKGIKVGLAEQSQQNFGFQSVIAEVKEMVPVLLPYVGARAFADLRGQDVSTKPPNWFFRKDEELPSMVHGAQLHGTDMRFAEAAEAFLMKADLSAAQLQGANLTGAQLQEANLNGAQLQRANLVAAQLQKANLNGAQLQKAKLLVAQLQKAKLLGAQLQEAFLIGAQLQEADLMEAQLQGANLYAAQLQKANLFKAQLQKANLRAAQLQKANLYAAQLQEADLSAAQLQKASLGEAQLQKANLQKANLNGAQLQEADLSEAQLLETDLRGAQLESARGLTQNQINQACLNGLTKLPRGLKWSKACKRTLAP